MCVCMWTLISYLCIRPNNGEIIQDLSFPFHENSLLVLFRDFIKVILRKDQKKYMLIFYILF